MPAPDLTPSPSPASHPGRKALRYVVLLVAVVTALGAGWKMVGSRAWDDFKVMREAQREAEDSAPVGYLGANYRRSYNNRPVKFGVERDGRVLLIATMGDDGRPTDFYDVTG